MSPPLANNLAPLTPLERRTTSALAAVFAMRMLGLFVVLPVLAIYGRALEGATPLLIGLAIGAYGLVQGLLQIPFGILSDRFGRKPLIFIGLAMFALGGLVAAMSETIWGVVIGRALQGAGAVSGVVMALLSDLTRESHQTRAMAIIGATVGLSFGLAMVLGPLLVDSTGLAGLFVFTSVMAVASLLLVMFYVPTPVAAVTPSRRRLVPQLARVLRHQGLFRLDLGIFLLHMVMVAVFVVIPPSLEIYEQLPAARHWHIYLPVILVSLLLMVPIMIQAERTGRTVGTLLAAAAALVLSLVMLAMLHRSMWGVVASLLLYFTAFNLLEALMPSMVSRMSPAGARGAAMGVYSSGQFFGAFFGGLLGGGLSSMFSPAVVLVTCAVLFAAWAILAAGLNMSSSRRNLVLDLPANVSPQTVALALLGVQGVLEATAVREDGVVHVTIDIARCDAEKLHERLGELASEAQTAAC